MKILNLLIGLLICGYSFSQSHISGRVISSETGQPLAAASVFAQNTTLGTATDAEGNFKLYLPAGGYDIVVTFTGYQTESKRISMGEAGNDNLQFNLKQKEKELAEVSVVATGEVTDGWEKYGSFFKDQFIGKTLNSQQATIQNPAALRFFYSKKRNRLKVLASEPLLIENFALGYNIRYELDSFIYEYNTENAVYTGFPLFEEMKTDSYDQKFKWAEARREAYKGSILHFMRSIYHRNLNEQGFEIQFLVKINEKETAIKVKDFYGALKYNKYDSLQVVEIKPNQPNVAVLYKHEKPAQAYLINNPGEPKDFQFSVLNFYSGDPVTIEQNGYYYEQNDLAIASYWTWDRVANLLPYDYIPL